MDASRLLEVLEDIEYGFENGYGKALRTLMQAYTSARDAPTQDLSSNIATAHDQLESAMEEFGFATYPPSKLQILVEIGGSELVGEDAVKNLSSRLSGVGMSGGASAATVAEFVKDSEDFRKTCKQVRDGLSALDIKPHVVEPDTCEVGVLIPDAVSDGTLTGLNASLSEWNQILRAFSELAEEKEREVAVRGFASGSIDAYVGIGIVAAGFLSQAIDKLFDWYKKILEIQKLRQELAAHGAPVDEAKAVKEYEKKLLDDAIEKIVRELLAEKKPPPGRVHEIDSHLALSLRRIARFIDQGGDVEVTCGAPEVPDEPEEPVAGDDPAAHKDAMKRFAEDKKTYNRLLAQAEFANEISERGAKARSLPERVKPILQLTKAELKEPPTEASKKKQ